MTHKEKIGKPVIEDEGGQSIELGQPVINKEFEKESAEATLVVIKEALDEFYARKSSREGDKKYWRHLKPENDKLKLYKIAENEIKKENSDLMIPLAILEAAKGEIQFEYDTLNSADQDDENQKLNERLAELSQFYFEKEMHYQEAADFLFSHAGYETPTHEELLEYLGSVKEKIKKLAVEEKEGAESGENVTKIFSSRLLTDVPAIERYETGRQVTADYSEIMDTINSLLLSVRNRIGDILVYYLNPPINFIDDMGQSLKEARKIELFLSQLEGERNERIAKKQS